MAAPKKVKNSLDKKFQKVQNTPASFGLYEAIHDFVEHIEANASLTSAIFARTKANRELNITGKYAYLKQIYQGLEDANSKSSADLGHSRYAVLIELNRIKNNDVSESLSFWKKREVFRKITAEVYERLHPELA
ncbi:MAG: hypothetical protein Q7S28_02795 [bacterium]|nr:hypothetical protein [bacterium]